jgi:hypothetical protein
VLDSESRRPVGEQQLSQDVLLHGIGPMRHPLDTPPVQRPIDEHLRT